eukprot:s621_g4.t3
MLVLFLDVVVVFLVVAVPCSCGVWAQATKPRPERPAGKAKAPPKRSDRQDWNARTQGEDFREPSEKDWELRFDVRGYWPQMEGAFASAARCKGARIYGVVHMLSEEELRVLDSLEL